MTDADFDAVAIVVVNYGSAELLRVNLAPLARAATGISVVVVDNLSTAQERARITALAADEGWSAVLPSANLGFGAGMNLGIDRARADGARFFLLLNPDAVIDPHNLRVLAERVRAAPLTVVSPTVLRPDGSLWFGGSDLYLDDGRIKSRRRRDATTTQRVEPWLSGACLLISAELWDRVGGFVDAYFLYWEDVDLSYRVVRAGGSIEVCSDAVATHAEGGTQGTDGHSSGTAKSATYYYYNIRNRLVFASLNLSTSDLERWLKLTVPVAREILLQGGRRQFLRSLTPLTAGLRGVRDGRRVARSELRRRRQA